MDNKKIYGQERATCQPAPERPDPRSVLKQVHHPRRHHLGLAGAGTGDDLEIAAVGLDGSLLVGSVGHGCLGLAGYSSPRKVR